MLMLITLGAIWALLMCRSCIAEYNYYQSVKTLEPDIWQQLGSPKFLKVPMVFVSPKGAKLLKNASNEQVLKLAATYRQAGLQFLSFVVLALVVSIIYFKMA
ncbi:hypothetical protein HII17_10510 [Thalassotalea sp. M1531]|uniref:Uncharacterized protein n=1 Tax=Thalassotalea algicola TaxID=2716224 RepID=A0A7Y0Q6G6_9GAMM|nr:hypothetical protein [Thalassotalea algicola]NMP31999.1 hypothetical protein [Thalassotalea algicola]